VISPIVRLIGKHRISRFIRGRVATEVEGSPPSSGEFPVWQTERGKKAVASRPFAIILMKRL
jgi:hypothetical protein